MTMAMRVCMLLAALAWALAPMPAAAHSHKAKGLEIVHPWTPAMTDPVTRNVTVYMVLKNSGAGVERLRGGSTPLADKVELIDLQSIGGARLPAPVAAIAIPVRGSRELVPDGARLLLSGFKRQLHAYDSFEMTLEFEKAGRVVIEVQVEEADTKAPHKH